MALVVKHEFVSGVADGADATQIQPSHWNAAHTLSGSADIAQVDGLQDALDAKVSSNSLSAALAAYVTSASLATALGAYTTSASLATALGPYLTSASAASSFVTSNSLSAVLAAYVTSNSMSAALAAYITSDSLSAALATYVSSNSLSAALATYVTSSSLATALGPYLTSASAALGTYLTSLSASTALALKQDGILFQDETVALSTTGAAAIVNFTGTGISASLTGGILTVTSAAGGGEGSVSISTMISVAPTLAPTTLTVAGTATFSGTAVFTTALKANGTLSVSGATTLAQLTAVTASFTAVFTQKITAVTATFASAVFTSNTEFLATGTAIFRNRPEVRTDSGSVFASACVLLGEISLGAALQSVRFSGSWTNIARFQLEFVGKVSAASSTASIAIYADGGTTPFLNGGSITLSVSHCAVTVDILDSGAFKSIKATRLTAVVVPITFHTCTANALVINCIQFAAGASVTMSAGIAQLWGHYR